MGARGYEARVRTKGGAGHIWRAARGQKGRLLNLLSFGVMFVVWFGLTGLGYWTPIVDPVFLPSPLAVAETFVRLLEDGYQGQSLGFHVAMSLMRFGIAFSICIMVAVPVGLMMGMSSSIQSVLDPPIEITRPVPKLALLPLLIIWFGIGELPKVFIIILGVFPLLSISAMQAVKGVPKKKVQAAYSLGASSWIVFRRVMFPASLGGIFTGIRVSLGVGVTMLVGAEMIATSNGIAWMALNAAQFLLTNVVIVGIAIMAVIGYGLDHLVRVVESRVVHWSGKEEG